MKQFYEDKSAISIAQNLMQHEMTKHVEVDRHLIKEKLEAAILKIQFVPLEQHVANALNKGLSS